MARSPEPLVETLRPKPLLRGVSHEIAAAFAFVGGIVLADAATGVRGRVAAIVYGLSLFTLFSVSALYHRPRWSRRLRARMKRLDHAAIFVLIAGTYTPVCLLVPSAGGTALLTVVWAGALAGVILAILLPRAPKPLVAAVYVALGWAAIPLLPALARALGPAGLGLLAAGGVIYSIGAVVYALRRPDPFPTIFGYHEVFHALVIVAASFQYAAVLEVVGSL